MSSKANSLPGEREVGGLRCGEVLGGLTEYTSGGLDAETRARIEAHVRGCSQCERFGADFARAIRAIRASAEPPSADVLVRLEGRLAR
ncbi:MAG: zf-HC2 domain-containing protein [Deltaproteobacteria bacterium]|nr:zf-HC2 domain-containing protein [Deltaproteobacteria bacterium]